MKEIEICGGAKAQVDDDDYDRLVKIKWYLCCGYAVNRSRGANGVIKWTRMHRVVNNTPDGMYTDHIDGNKLNNQKENLRTCTKRQNNMNKTKNNNKTGYKGVWYEQKSGKYMATITINRKQRTIGRFKTKEAAAIAYNKAALQLHGEFAHLNVLKEA